MADEIKQLLERSNFSFVGSIVHLGAATMTNIPIDDHTAVVHIDHVLHAPDAFAHMEGQRITIQLAPDADVPTAGQTWAFFVEGLAIGESVAVREIGRLPVDSVEPHVTAALASGTPASAFYTERHEMKQGKIRDHMLAADAVVLGRVVSIEKIGPSSHSEHDPDWWRATIEVFHVERGNVPAGNVQVLFANSRDVRWYSAPKATASQGGAWILHATEGALQALAPFQILHPEDFQPTQQLDQLRNPAPGT
jgi:hypothetical protein